MVKYTVLLPSKQLERAEWVQGESASDGACVWQRVITVIQRNTQDICQRWFQAKPAEYKVGMAVSAEVPQALARPSCLLSGAAACGCVCDLRPAVCTLRVTLLSVCSVAESQCTLCGEPEGEYSCLSTCSGGDAGGAACTDVDRGWGSLENAALQVLFEVFDGN